MEKIQVANALQETPLINLVTLEPVRGYRKYQREVSQFLSNLGKKREAIKIFSMVLSAAGEQSGDYSSKLHIRLQSGMSAKQATVIILKRLLELMRQNEPGIKTDIDTEFLHDYRVAVRRTRSALTQIKGIFPEEIVRRFKKDFAAVGKSTNQLRDLDVYLLNKERFKAMLPEEQRPKLEPLFQFLEAERKKQHHEFVQALNGASYNEMLTQWETLLNTTESGEEKAKNANKPVVSLARKFICKQYHQVMNLGNVIDDSTPDEELHKLRIECKKLRYLLEFYAALFPQKEMAFLIKQLKSLQDNLGEFNDLCVQQPELKKFMDRVIPSHNESIATAVAIGGLIANLYHRQQQVRMAFSQKFQEFSQQENAELYQKLFR
ncbi:CHAD domain-containing protein [candidate division KSB1 bacterium]|nr:CHAD domain-containing protein [candidate division KSB1 bacterium]